MLVIVFQFEMVFTKLDLYEFSDFVDYGFHFNFSFFHDCINLFTFHALNCSFKRQIASVLLSFINKRSYLCDLVLNVKPLLLLEI